MHTKRLVLVALLVAGALTACGKGDVKPASSGAPTTSSTEATTSTTEAAAAEPSAIELTATEYAYQADVLTVPAGAVAVSLVNDGAEEHQATIVKFKEGKGLAELSDVAANDPGALSTVIDTFGGPNAVAPGGGSETTTQTLEPGDYVFMCFIPAPDGQPHAAKGMAAPFTVEETDAAEEAAPADNEIVVKEFAFGVDEGKAISAGEYDITNEGEQLHEAAIYTPADGSTVDDVIAYFSNPAPEGPPPVVPAGGIAATNPGTSVKVDLKPGEYVFMCFLPDTDGTPHFAKGMITAVTVS